MVKKNTSKNFTGFSDFERAAMRERAQELRAEARSSKNRAEGERAVLAAIAAMPEPDRSMAKKVHALVKANAPKLLPKTWYGMPAYTNKDGKAVCFFQGGDKYKVRYSSLGFNDSAKLDEGSMWPTAFALKKIGSAEEKKIVALIKKAAR